MHNQYNRVKELTEESITALTTNDTTQKNIFLSFIYFKTSKTNIAELLEVNKSIESIELYGCSNNTKEMIDTILQPISTFPHFTKCLTHLNINEFLFSKTKAPIFFSSISALTNLHVLKIPSNNLTLYNPEEIASCIEKLTKLHTLNISHNQLGDEKINTIFKALENTVVKNIDIGGNLISDTGFGYIIEALQTNRHISKIVLTANFIKGYMDSNSSYLKHNTALKELHLDFNNIQCSNIKNFLNLFVCNRSLLTLNLRDNNLTCFAMPTISEWIKKRDNFIGVSVSYSCSDITDSLTTLYKEYSGICAEWIRCATKNDLKSYDLTFINRVLRYKSAVEYTLYHEENQSSTMGNETKSHPSFDKEDVHDKFEQTISYLWNCNWLLLKGVRQSEVSLPQEIINIIGSFLDPSDIVSHARAYPQNN